VTLSVQSAAKSLSKLTLQVPVRETDAPAEAPHRH
jgi:hypothetical protein